MSEGKNKDFDLNNITDYLRDLSEAEFVTILQDKFKVRLDPKSRRNLNNLYSDLQKGETWFELDLQGELLRHTKVANIDVFYVSSDGKNYILKEDKRLTLPKGSTPQDYFEGKVEPIRVQPQRKTNHSISERMRTHTKDEEEPINAAIRGVFEEIFESTDIKINGNESKDFISRNLQFNGIVVSTRSKDDKDNSYSGLKVTYHNHNFVLVIPEPDKPFFEFDSKKGYLNTFVWEEIPGIELITFMDEENKEHTRTIISENSPDILREVMICEQKKNKYDYDLRSTILRISNGKIETYQAYSKDPAILDDEYRKREDLGSYLANPNNWLPERVEIHKRIIEHEFSKVLRLSEVLAESIPTIFMLRGNNGAGKSTLTMTHERFNKARGILPNGIINTDFYDKALRDDSKIDGKATVTAKQVHEEGGVIEKKIRQMACDKSELSLIFDKRFSVEKQLTEILTQAGNRNIEIYDLDVPLEISVARVLARKKDEDAPLVDFETLSRGLIGIRGLRKALIEVTVQTNQRISYYLLLETSSIPSIRIASKENDFFQIEPDHKADFSRLIKPVEANDLHRLGDIVITDNFIHEILKSFTVEVRFKLNSEFKKYVGKTIKNALEEASKNV